MKNISIVAVFGLVSYLFSYGLQIPQSLKVLNIVAAASAMAGYPCGLYVQKYIPSKGFAVLVLALVALLTVCFFLSYVIWVQTNPSGFWAVYQLGFLMAFAFFGFGMTMSGAGIVVGKIED